MKGFQNRTIQKMVIMILQTIFGRNQIKITILLPPGLLLSFISYFDNTIRPFVAMWFPIISDIVLPQARTADLEVILHIIKNDFGVQVFVNIWFNNKPIVTFWFWSTHGSIDPRKNNINLDLRSSAILGFYSPVIKTILMLTTPTGYNCILFSLKFIRMIIEIWIFLLPLTIDLFYIGA